MRTNDRAWMLVAGAGLAGGLAIGGAPPAALAQADPLAEPFGAVVNVEALPAGTSLAIGPRRADGHLSLTGCGDINADGRGDALLAYGAVVYGRAMGASGPRILDLAALAGEDGFRFAGSRNAAPVGDINGDGIDDFALSNEDLSVDGMRSAGRAYVVFGREGGFPDGVNLGSLDGTDGFALLGAAEWTGIGTGIGPAGDLNGDGIGDLLVSGEGYRAGVNGALHIIFGRDQAGGAAFPAGIVLDEPTDGSRVRFDGNHRTDWHGSVAALGDVNGDGLDDAAVVERFRLFVLFGRTASEPWPSTFDADDLNGSTGFAATGLQLLTRVAGAGDFNGDGLNDILLGAPYADPGGRRAAGLSAVLFGRDRTAPLSPIVDLDSMAPEQGFQMQGINPAFPSEDDGDRSGYSIAGPGDVNGDGFDDVLIGAPGGDYTGSPVYGRGEAYLVYGRSEPFAEPLMLSELGGGIGVTFHGGAVSSRFGGSVASASDFNGDGRPDMLIGSRLAGTPGIGSGGVSYVVLGRGPCPADLDRDGALTIFDFLTFGNLFDAMDPRADFDGDGDFTIFDFLAFQNAFDAGCP
jgi:glycosylphosphatidylinositol phospholipase D